MATEKQIKYWKSLIGNKKGFQKGHKFYKGGEKGWFKKGTISPKKGTGEYRVCKCCNKVYYGSSNRGKKFCSRKWVGSEYKVTQPLPPIHRMKGEKNPQWKGGVTPKNKIIRSSSEFKQWRKQVFEYDNYTCWICGVRGKKIHPHHLKSFSKYPNLRFVKSNGLTLCEYCHKTYTNFGGQKQNA
jgi:hypothetical protein